MYLFKCKCWCINISLSLYLQVEMKLDYVKYVAWSMFVLDRSFGCHVMTQTTIMTFQLQDHVGGEYRDASVAVGKFIPSDLYAKNIRSCEKVSESI